MASNNFNIRLDDDLRNRAFPVLESYGLTASQAFKLFLNQVAETKTVPLSFDWQAQAATNQASSQTSNQVPNLETQAAMQEALENRATAKRYDSFDEVMTELSSDQ